MRPLLCALVGDVGDHRKYRLARMRVRKWIVFEPQIELALSQTRRHIGVALLSDAIGVHVAATYGQREACIVWLGNEVRRRLSILGYARQDQRPQLCGIAFQAEALGISERIRGLSITMPGAGIRVLDSRAAFSPCSVQMKIWAGHQRNATLVHWLADSPAPSVELSNGKGGHDGPRELADYCRSQPNLRRHSRARFGTLRSRVRCFRLHRG